MDSYKKIYSLTLGGYVNGYCIIKELYEYGLRNIALFYHEKSLASLSNKVSFCKKIAQDSLSLEKAIFDLKKECDYIIIFPTNDLHLENLKKIYDKIESFCFIPFNHTNITHSLNKTVQYSFCDKFQIPYPKTINVKSKDDFRKIKSLTFPLIIKPIKRYDINSDLFRNMLLNDIFEFNKHFNILKKYINQGISFSISEFIPGNDSNIYAYVGYRSKSGKILNEWIGKKLSQYPNKVGVFSSASNVANKTVLSQGRKLLEVMNLMGIIQPEFKYDQRDKKYKLMEINLRSMMWHRVGNLSGVNLQVTQYLDALGKDVPKQIQNCKDKVHFLYMKHELENILFKRGYWKLFKYNFFHAKKREFAVYQKDDILPFIFDLIYFIRGVISRCLKILNLR